jgi:hypothetical protein
MRVPLAGGAAEYVMSREEIYQVERVRIVAGRAFFVNSRPDRDRLYMVPVP